MGQTPDYVVYHEVVLTTKEYMHHVTAVDPYWLGERGSMFFRIKSSLTDKAGRLREERDEAARMEAEHANREEYHRKERDAIAAATPAVASRIFTPGVRAPRASPPPSRSTPSFDMDDDGELLSRRRTGPPARKRVAMPSP